MHKTMARPNMSSEHLPFILTVAFCMRNTYSRKQILKRTLKACLDEWKAHYCIYQENMLLDCTSPFLTERFGCLLSIACHFYQEAWVDISNKWDFCHAYLRAMSLRHLLLASLSLKQCIHTENSSEIVINMLHLTPVICLKEEAIFVGDPGRKRDHSFQ